MPINQSLLKYGYQSFSLTILEFCNIDSLVPRERHFFDVYSPEYNILKTPGSPDRGKGVNTFRSYSRKNTYSCE